MNKKSLAHPHDHSSKAECSELADLLHLSPNKSTTSWYFFSLHHLQARFLSDTKAPGCSLRAQRSYWRVGREALLHTGVTWGEKTFWSSSTFQPNIKKLFLFLAEVRLATQRPVCVYLLSIQSLPLKHMFLKAEEELEQAFDHFQRHRLCTKACGPPPHDKHTLAFSTCFSQTSFETCVLSLWSFSFFVPKNANILAKLSERLMKWKLIAFPLFRYCEWFPHSSSLLFYFLDSWLWVFPLYSRSCIFISLSCFIVCASVVCRADHLWSFCHVVIFRIKITMRWKHIQA